jgi:alkaline phosphatase
MIGAGHPDWVGHHGYISSADHDGFRAGAVVPYSEYVFVERTVGQDGGANLDAAVQEILDPNHAAHGRKLFGLFGGPAGYLEHPVPRDAPGTPGFDWPAGAEENPSLAECTTAALRVLVERGGANGLFLMVEGGDVDWANHACDFAWMVGAARQLDEAVAAAVAFVDDPSTPLTWDNTLLIVTADHANGYLRFAPGRVLGRGDLPTQRTGSPPWYPDDEIAYGAPGAHTNEPVTLYAGGRAAALFAEYEGRDHPGTRLLDHTAVFDVMRRAIGLTPLSLLHGRRR